MFRRISPCIQFPLNRRYRKHIRIGNQHLDIGYALIKALAQNVFVRKNLDIDCQVACRNPFRCIRRIADVVGHNIKCFGQYPGFILAVFLNFYIDVANRHFVRHISQLLQRPADHPANHQTKREADKDCQNCNPGHVQGGFAEEIIGGQSQFFGLLGIVICQVTSDRVDIFQRAFCLLFEQGETGSRLTCLRHIKRLLTQLTILSKHLFVSGLTLFFKRVQIHFFITGPGFIEIFR